MRGEWVDFVGVSQLESGTLVRSRETEGRWFEGIVLGVSETFKEVALDYEDRGRVTVHFCGRLYPSGSDHSFDIGKVFVKS